MPSWKKVIISGSNAELTSLYAPSITGSLQGTASFASTASNVQGGTARYIPIWNTSSSLSSSAIYQSATGDVGIGTTTPYAKLTVQTSGSDDNLNAMIANFGKSPLSTGYGSTFIRVARSTATTTLTGSADYTDIEHNSAGGTPFRYGTFGDTNIINGGRYTAGKFGSINFVTSGSTRMTVAGGTSAGRVGIGTTSPNATLDVNGNTIITGSLTVTANITSSGLLVTGSTAGNLVRITQTGAGNAFVVEDSANPDANAFVIDNTGKVFIGATSASGTFNSMSPAPKLDVSGSVVIAGKIQIGDDTDTTNEYKLYSGQGPIFARTSDPLIGDAAIVGVAYNSTDIGPTLGTYIGVNGNATAGDDDDPASTYIGGTFYAGGNVPSNNYAVRLQDGSQGIGKLLVSQTADGKARWSTQLSGSYGLTGSLSFPMNSSLLFSSSNSSHGRMHVSNLPNPLGGSTVSSPLDNYGDAGEGLYIQYGYSIDQGGIKITDDGVAVFGAGDTDLFKVVNEDTTLQVFAINDVNQVGINKAFTPGVSTPMNATLDVNGNTIITGSLTVTNSAIISGSTTVNGVLSITSGSSVSFTASNSSLGVRMHVSNLPNPLGTSNVSSPLYNYGNDNEGLYIQFGESTNADQGGIKITDDGVAVFGAGDEDLFKVINEDTNEQIFVVNDSGAGNPFGKGQVGINKAFTPGNQTAMNAALDVNGNTIITGSLTVTGSYASPAGNTIDSNALIQASLLYLSNNF